MFPLFRNPARWGKKTYEVRFIRDMKVVKGKRWWLVAWAGKAADGDAWDDSWEPTENVSEALRVEYLSDRRERKKRTVLIDVRPLDKIFQKSIAHAIVHHSVDTFGHVHKNPVLELSLRELADFYIHEVAERFDLEISSGYLPEGHIYLKEIRITDPGNIGDFLEFEKYVPSNNGLKNLRFHRRGDLTAVGTIYIRYLHNRRTPGLVSCMYEVVTVKINGATGELVAAHLPADEGGHYEPMNYEADKAALADYVRDLIPPNHPLRVNGWTDMHGLNVIS